MNLIAEMSGFSGVVIIVAVVIGAIILYNFIQNN